MSSKDLVISLLRQFSAEVLTQTANLSGVFIYKIKDDKIIFMDSKGSKFELPIRNIEKIILQVGHSGDCSL